MPRIFLAAALIVILIGSCHGQYKLTGGKSGIFTGLNIGTWAADNSNKILGNPLIIGLTAGIKKAENSYALNFDLIGLLKNGLNEPIAIHFDKNNSFCRKYYTAHLSFEYARQLFGTKRPVIEAVCGWDTEK
jgi:hypothetical protein